MRLVALASLLALVLTATAAAVTSAKDPAQLMLARTDFPAGAKYNTFPMDANYLKALAASGIKAKATAYFAQLGTKGETVSGLVNTTGSTSQAQKLYKLMKADLAPKPGSVVRLPAYGDEQIATLDVPDSKALLYVRKGSVMWTLEVNLNLLTKAQTLAQLQAYAVKQKRRIGSG
jgi:hypothetical protein